MNAIDDMKKKFADRDGNQFDDWWYRERLDLPLDQKDVARRAFEAALAISRNYVADDEVDALQFTFANGRIVQWSENGLRIGMVETK